jgi:hypothetical protein
MDMGALESVAAAFNENEQRLKGMAESDLDFTASCAKLAQAPLNLIGWHIRHATEDNGDLCRAFQLYEGIAIRTVNRMAEMCQNHD